MRAYVAGLPTGFAVSVAVASGAAGVSMMNHVGINVLNTADAIKDDTEKMRYRAAFRVPAVTNVSTRAGTMAKLVEITPDSLHAKALAAAR